MNAEPNTDIRLKLPPAGGAVSFTIVASIVAFFVGVAAYNLRHSAALSALEIGGSLLWLCIAGLSLVFGIAEAGGFRRSFVNCLGMFSRRAFIEICRPGEGPVMFRFGFECLGREFDYAHIELARIGMVHWGAGQASDMSGRDQDDWTVAVWYWKPSCTGPWNRRTGKDMDIIIVTPYLPKEEAAAVGRSVIEALNDVGVQLVPDDRDYFIVTGAEGDKGQPGPSETAP